jgi:hypothetical protein
MQGSVFSIKYTFSPCIGMLLRRKPIAMAKSISKILMFYDLCDCFFMIFAIVFL